MIGGVRTAEQTSMKSFNLCDYDAIKDQSVLI